VTDISTTVNFLIGTDADLCVYPRMVREPRQRSPYKLTAANTIIHTYGTETLMLNFGLRRTFTWRFVIADVTKPIVGPDFLAHYGLLVDLRNCRLVDQLTSLSTRGRCTRFNVPSVKTPVRRRITRYWHDIPRLQNRRDVLRRRTTTRVII